MAGTSHIPGWNPLRADFSDSNQALGIAQRGLSDAGTIFGNIRASMLKAEQDAVENAFREKQLAENARQFGITSAEAARNNDLDFTSSMTGHDITARGQDISAQTAANKLALDQREFAIKEADALRANQERQLYNQAIQNAFYGDPKAKEQFNLNSTRIQELNNQLSKPMVPLTGTVLDLYNPALSAKGKEGLVKERNQLIAANKQLERDLLPAVSRQELVDRANRGLAASGFGYLAAPTLLKEGNEETNTARAREVAIATANAGRVAKEEERDFKTRQDLAKAARESKKDAQKTLSKLLEQSTPNQMIGSNYRDEFNKGLEYLDSQGFDPRDVATVLSRYNTSDNRWYSDTDFQDEIQNLINEPLNSTILRQIMIEARNNNRLPERR